MNYTKKIILWFVVFVATGIGAFLSLQRNNEGTSSTTNFPNIAIKDTAELVSIVLSKGAVKMQLNQKVRNQWSVNDTYTARPQLMQLLIFGLSHLEVKRPIAAEDAGEWKKQISKKAIHITVQTNSKTVAFYLMQNPTDPNSSIYADEQLQNFYIAHVPGVKGDLATLTALEKADWRSKDIFKSTVYSIHALTMQYNGAAKDNFKIEFKNNTFSLENIPNADSLKIKKYLSLIPVLGVEKYLNLEVDSVKSMIKSATPYAMLSIEDDMALRSETVQLYFTKDKKSMIAQVGSSKEWASLSPQMWRFALVPKRFFEKKQQ